MYASSITLLPLATYPGTGLDLRRRAHAIYLRTATFIFAFHSAWPPAFVGHVRARVGAGSLASSPNAVVGPRLTHGRGHADASGTLGLL